MPIQLKQPPVWSAQELESERQKATGLFRKERLDEPLEEYLEAFDKYQGVFEDLLETTLDLSDLNKTAIQILTDENYLRAFRYLSGPPISADDLKTVADAVLTKARLKKDPEMVSRILDIVRSQLDRRRFPWVAEDREPKESERNAAVLASAAILATQWLQTNRRSATKQDQEQKVEEIFLTAGLIKVPTRLVRTLGAAPAPGEFCRESTLGNRKADFILRLWDDRLLALECKVSNSATNSVKRLNNDAAAKAEAWLKDFGKRQVIPTAVLSGVFKLHNLDDAQSRGLTLFWAHDLDSLVKWIGETHL